MCNYSPCTKSGFTLIELSIVLVIIGLIVGGILTGQDLIKAAAIRAQIAQIEKYNTAVRTFQNKYGGLPGDLPDPMATQFGFQPRGQWQGEGDGNGILEGNCGNVNNGNTGLLIGCGELAVFWEDLSEANLIDTSIFGKDTKGVGYPYISGQTSTMTINTTPGIKDWLPAAKLGQGNFIYIYSLNGINYFDLQLVYQIGSSLESTGNPGSGANAVTVQQAYNIDKKTDDGFPQSGSITACDADYDVNTTKVVWAAGSGNAGAGGVNCVPTTTATGYHTYNCFDNNGTAGTQTYSLSQNANLMNCALSFRFQ